LAALVAAAEQHNQGCAAFLEVNPVAGAVVDPQLADPLSDRLSIAGMSIGKTILARRNQGSSPLILQARSPFPKSFGLLEFEHGSM